MATRPIAAIALRRSEDAFRIDADVANNRLLVRANDVELEEVVSILTKLGEIPRTAAGGSLSRVLNVAPGDDAVEFLKRLERDWKVTLPEPADPARVAAAAPAKDGAPPPKGRNRLPRRRPAVPDVTAKTVPTVLYRTALFQQPEPERAVARSEATSPPASPTVPPASAPAVTGKTGRRRPAAPIVVSVGPDGRLVISSNDPEALAMFEEFAARIAPPAKDYQIFHLKSASATWVVLNLEDYFEEEDESKDRSRDRFMSYMYGYGMPSSSTEDDNRRLSKRRTLRFISDIDTNTILVQGADAEQLKTIKELIELYDVPEPVNSQKARVTKLITIKYSKASVVAAVIKDAYRDLLSTNDPALQGGREGRMGSSAGGGGMTIISPFRRRRNSRLPTHARPPASKGSCRSASTMFRTRCWCRPKATIS